MMGNTFSEMVDSFQRGDVPKWLTDYVRNNRQRIITRLQMDRVVLISSPDQSIVITIKRVNP
jgi:hypothetical protein